MPFARGSDQDFSSPILPPSKGILVLRHAHPATLIGGSRLSAVRARLGHRSILTTERYVHLLRGQEAGDAAVLDDLLGCDLPALTEPERDALIDLDLPVAPIDDRDDVAA